jgi:hypothetical protein
MQRFLFLLLLLPAGVWAQGFSVSGTVKDSAGVVLPGALVQLLQDADSAASIRTCTDDKGAYTFKEVAQGVYNLRVQATGYTMPIRTLYVDAPIDNMALVMQRGNTVLKEVTVSSKKPYMETGLGKTVLNLDAATVTAGSNVLDLLRKSPGVTIDGDNNIKLEGTGALVLVDDKQTYMSGQQLADYLKGLSAEQVAQLELITQPSSKYDAEGVGGIINIKTRKLRKRGFNGNLSTSVGRGKFGNTHNSLNLTWRRDKWTVYTNAGYYVASGFLTADVKRALRDANTYALLATHKQHTYMKETFEDYSLRAGTDYDVNDKLTVGAGAKGIYHPNNQVDTTIVAIGDATTGTRTYNRAINRHGFKRYNGIMNAYARYKPAQDHVIDINADYLLRDHNEYVNLESYNYDAQMQGIPGNVLLRGNQTSYIAPVAVKADYSGTWSKDWKMEAGIKSSYAYINKVVALQQEQNGNWVYDSIRSNNFTYKEQINAAYANATCQLSKQWVAQAGIRVEQLYATGYQQANDQSIERNTTDVFPTVFVSYKPVEKHSFELNYGRRIQRPTYVELDPFVQFISQYLYKTGNPFLQASYRNYAELKHNYNNILFSSVSASRITGIANPAVVYDAITKALYHKPLNNANQIVLHASCGAQQKIIDWWLLGWGGDYYYNEFEDLVTGSYVSSSHGFSGYITNQFTLGKGWTIDTLYQYASGDLQSMIERNKSTHYLSFNVGRKFWKDTATIKLSAEDPFAMYGYRSVLRNNGVAGDADMKYATQMFSLGFTYNFGKQADIRAREYSADEAKRM